MAQHPVPRRRRKRKQGGVGIRKAGRDETVTRPRSCSLLPWRPQTNTFDIIARCGAALLLFSNTRARMGYCPVLICTRVFLQVNRWFANRRRKVSKRPKVVTSPAGPSPSGNGTRVYPFSYSSSVAPNNSRATSPSNVENTNPATANQQLLTVFTQGTRVVFLFTLSLCAILLLLLMSCSSSRA